jgi:ribosome-binding protein aMBF1 (putative translation factor)
MNKEQREIFDSLVEPSQTFEKMKERQKNRKLNKRLAFIALDVLCAMDEQGISKEELAKSLEISIEDVNLLCKGRLDFSVSLALRIEKVLGVVILKPTELEK